MLTEIKPLIQARPQNMVIMEFRQLMLLKDLEILLFGHLTGATQKSAIHGKNLQ